MLKLYRNTWLRYVGHVDEDIVGRVAVQRCAEALLVKVVANEADAASEDEQTVERADLDVLVCFVRCECTAVAQKINEADSNTTIDIQNEL